MRYGREELEALRYQNLEPPEGVELPVIDELEQNQAQQLESPDQPEQFEQPSTSRNKKRKRNRPNKPRKKPTGPRQPYQEEDDEDEDGDFGGMFSDENIFAGVFVDPEDQQQQQQPDFEEEEEDEDDDMGPAQRVAFVVEGEPDFSKEEPDDGWEYIRRVKWEAARCPGLKVATISPEKLVDNQTSYIPSVPVIATCDASLIPSHDWETRFLQTFSNLRTKFESWEPPAPLSKPIPGNKDDAGWKTLCFGSSDQSPVSVAEELEEFGAGPMNFYRGELTTLLNLDEVSRALLLRKQVSWIKEMDHLPRNRALWLFALTAAVDKPIDADTSFALRSLLRSCAAIRASGKFENHQELQLLNMIIAVAGKYFGQDDTNRC